MSAKGGSRELIWIAAGVLGFLIAFFTMLSLRGDRTPAIQIASRAERLEIVNRLRLSLAAASEAQNSAVMSAGEQDSKSFAEASRFATAAMEREHSELEEHLTERGDSQETELMNRFSESLREFQKVDAQLRDLAVQSSNRKAYTLAFGPAMKLIQEIDEGLSRVVTDHKNLSSDNKLQLVQLADEIRIGTLRMQVLLLPHIAEANDQKMDAFEVRLTAEDHAIRQSFASLSALLPASSKPEIEKMAARYEEFAKLKSQIVGLSRQNTDVKALAIAMQEKRKAMLACQDALVALEQAIHAEPITTAIPSGRQP